MGDVVSLFEARVKRESAKPTKPSDQLRARINSLAFKILKERQRLAKQAQPETTP